MVNDFGALRADSKNTELPSAYKPTAEDCETGVRTGLAMTKWATLPCHFEALAPWQSHLCTTISTPDSVGRRHVPAACRNYHVRISFFIPAHFCFALSGYITTPSFTKLSQKSATAPRKIPRSGCSIHSARMRKQAFKYISCETAIIALRSISFSKVEVTPISAAVSCCPNRK